MKVAILKYNAGNIYSVVHGLNRLGIEPVVTDNAEELQSADRVLFPGQGEARTTMNYLHSHGLDNLIRGLKQPVLGICIGQQLMCSHSDEGNVDCLGIFDAEVQRFVPKRHEDKVPHMGWNNLRKLECPLFKGIDEGAFVYFVHSFYVPLTAYTVATSDYIVPFSAALHRGNFYATQFHPEKSGKVGEQILRNFLDVE
jgi:imidazole glycerol-phosphate synthase subunit HisH